MKIQQLVLFLAIEKNGSFFKAAEECFISQSALSKQIRSLEEELGVELFNRSSRTASITEAGRHLVPGHEPPTVNGAALPVRIRVAVAVTPVRQLVLAGAQHPAPSVFSFLFHENTSFFCFVIHFFRNSREEIIADVFHGTQILSFSIHIFSP